MLPGSFLGGEPLKSARKVEDLNPMFNLLILNTLQSMAHFKLSLLSYLNIFRKKMSKHVA
jgi:hypothetical protein